MNPVANQPPRRTGRRGPLAGSGRDQGPPAGGLGIGRLRRRRPDASDRRRIALRDSGPARRREGPRRRDGHRQRGHRRGASFHRSTATDFVSTLLEHGRARAAAEGLPVVFREADVQDLPFPDASFDVVLSTYGVMFALDQERAARELARVCRPGGRIVLANWTPEGFIGELFRLVGRYVPPPAGLRTLGCASCSAPRLRTSGSCPGSSRSVTGRLRTGSSCSGPPTARSTRRFSPSILRGRPRSRPTCSRCCIASTGEALPG